MARTGLFGRSACGPGRARAVAIGIFEGRLRDDSGVSLEYADIYAFTAALISYPKAFFFTPLF
jgi:hypothetical protein